MLQSNEINKKRMKEKYREEYFNRVKKVLKTSLNSRNTIQAINTYAVSSISYGFQVLDWSVTELEDIDRQTRNVLRKHHMLHNNSDTDRMYVSRPNGGRGLLNITDLYKTQMIAYSEYLKQSTERLMLLVSTLQQERGSKSIHHKANMYLAELGIDQEQHQYNKQQLKKMVKSKRTTIRIDTIREKKLHGQFLVNVYNIFTIFTILVDFNLHFNPILVDFNLHFNSILVDFNLHFNSILVDFNLHFNPILVG